MGEIATYEEIMDGIKNNSLKPRTRIINDLMTNCTEENEQNMLSISSLVPYSEHPFKLYESERLDDMVRSIKEMGILLPIIVRPLNKKNKTYQILAGHNRVNAAEIAGLTEVPVIIKRGLSNDEAKLIVTETNLVQRSFADLTHSERAISLKLHMDAISKQGKRNDIINEINMLLNTDKIKENETCGQVGHKLKSRELIAKTYGLSGTNVARYLRIAKLIESLQKRLDKDEISFIPAFYLSYLTTDEQTTLNSILAETSYRIDMKKAETLRTFSERKQLTNEKIISILSDEINKKKKANSSSFKINRKIYNKYFSENITQREIEEIIDKALEQYFTNNS